MPIDVKTIVGWMEEWAPPQLAEEWDPVGLQIGSPSAKVTRISVALDVTEAVVAEAIARGAELIVAHHPVIFRPLKKVITDSPEGKLISTLLKHDLSVFAAHTNLDVAVGGVNDMLAEALDIRNTVPLEKKGTETLYKLIVYVPGEHLASVQKAVFEAGAGWIGNYSHCGFSLHGTGTFRPEEGTVPFIGTEGQMEEVKEARFETVLPASRKGAVLRALQQAHPYEEVAYDVFQLELPGAPYGLGRIGTLPGQMTLQAFAERVKEALQVPALRVVGDGDKTVHKIAVLGGSGRGFIKHAIAAGADVLVTGDMDHHTAHDALAAGLAIVDAGHHIEAIMKTVIANRLNKRFQEEGAEAIAFPSSVSTEPFSFL